MGDRSAAALTLAGFLAAGTLAVGPLTADTAGASAPDGRQAVADTTDADTAGADSVRADTVSAGAARAAVPDSSVVYRREVFDYPAEELRDPFRPVSARQQTGPRLEDLTLTGIIFSPGTGSVAVLVNPNTGRRYQLRVGDEIGGARLLEITETRAVFRVDAFGFDRRTVLRLQREQESGS